MKTHHYTQADKKGQLGEKFKHHPKLSVTTKMLATQKLSKSNVGLMKIEDRLIKEKDDIYSKREEQK